MSKTYKAITFALLMLMAAGFVLSQTTLKWKPVDFENPGTRRLLRTAAGNAYFYRSQPEKSMTVKVKDLTAVEIRAISKAKVNKPEFVLKYQNKRTTFNLKLTAVSESYQIYEPVRITLPPGLTQLEIISYDRDTYFRVYVPVAVQSKKAKIPSLKITAKEGVHEVAGPTAKHDYYSFNDKTALAFQVNKGRPFSLYVRAELTSKQTPVFGIYEDGKLVQRYELSTKRTSTYKTEGINHLTIGKKVDFPAQDMVKTYELRSISKHKFIARPVIRKVQ